MVTQVMSSGTDPYSDHVVIDKGSNSGVYEGQPVISDRGVVGQVVAVSKFTSRVLLICDASHALPIQVLRNDIRVIAAGSGCSDDLLLEHLPSNTDIRVGDVLVTSGLGGRFLKAIPLPLSLRSKSTTSALIRLFKLGPPQIYNAYVIYCYCGALIVMVICQCHRMRYAGSPMNVWHQ